MKYDFIFQSIAILPGISRSGMVISSALMLGLNKEKSIQYCFFMVIPVIILSIFLSKSIVKATATAKYVFPVPAGPEDIIISISIKAIKRGISAKRNNKNKN